MCVVNARQWPDSWCNQGVKHEKLKILTPVAGGSIGVYVVFPPLNCDSIL